MGWGAPSTWLILTPVNLFIQSLIPSAHLGHHWVPDATAAGRARPELFLSRWVPELLGKTGMKDISAYSTLGGDDTLTGAVKSAGEQTGVREIW